MSRIKAVTNKDIIRIIRPKTNKYTGTHKIIILMQTTKIMPSIKFISQIQEITTSLQNKHKIKMFLMTWKTNIIIQKVKHKSMLKIELMNRQWNMLKSIKLNFLNRANNKQNKEHMMYPSNGSINYQLTNIQQRSEIINLTNENLSWINQKV